MCDDGVAANNEVVLGVRTGNIDGFALGVSYNVSLRGRELGLVKSFLKGGGDWSEGEAHEIQDFAASRGLGGEDYVLGIKAGEILENHGGVCGQNSASTATVDRKLSCVSLIRSISIDKWQVF